MATTNTGRAARAAEPAVRVAGDWRPALNLTLATLGFAVCFWAWALLGPLAPGIKERLGLSFAEQSLVVAVPVIVGSLGRIPVGALTDRFGARLMLPAVSLATVVPVLVLAYTQTSYAGLIVAGFFLGIGGTAFAVGVPYVSGWYPPDRRGFALGIFGIGMGGTAIANFTTVPLADASGAKAPFFLVAAVLVGYAVLALALIRDAHPPGVGASAGSWRSASTCRRTCARPTSFDPRTPPCARPASSWWPSSPGRSAVGCPTACIRCPCWLPASPGSPGWRCSRPSSPRSSRGRPSRCSAWQGCWAPPPAACSPSSARWRQPARWVRSPAWSVRPAG